MNQLKKNYKHESFNKNKSIFKNISRFFISQSIVEGTFGVFTLLMLWLIHIFSTGQNSKNLVILSICIGLTQIVLGFILGSTTASGTGCSTVFGRNLNSSVENRKRITDNTNIFLLFWGLTLTIIVGALGYLIVLSQNIHLPIEYKKLIHLIIYFYLAIIPASTFLYSYSSLLSAEGHNKVPGFIGIYLLLSFLIFALIFHYSHAFSLVNSNSDIYLSARPSIYIFGISLICSFYTCTIVIAIYYYYLVKTNNTLLVGNFNPFKNFDKKLFISYFELTFSIFIRNVGIIITVYIAYIGMRLIPIPNGSLENQKTFQKIFPNSAIYWQYVSSVFLPILVIIICFSSALARSFRFLVSKSIETNDKQYLMRIMKTQLIYTFCLGAFLSIIIIIIAPYLLESLGAKNGQVFYFIFNGHEEHFKGYKIKDHSTIALRIAMATIPFEFLTAAVVPHALVTHDIKKLLLAVSLRNIILYIPIFLLFCFLSKVIDHWYVAWLGYNVIDLLFGLITLLMFFQFKRQYNKTKNISDFIFEGR